MKVILGILIGVAINHLVIKPIETHEIQNELISKGCPKPECYKKHIWW